MEEQRKIIEAMTTNVATRMREAILATFDAAYSQACTDAASIADQQNRQDIGDAIRALRR